MPLETRCQALVVIFMNTLFPGSGTIVCALYAENDPTDDHRKNLVKKLIIIALLQLFLTIGLIGWLWSIFHAISVYYETMNVLAPLPVFENIIELEADDE